MSAILSSVPKIAAARLAKKIDRAVELQRQIEPLAKELAELKKFFRAGPDGEFVGHSCKASVVTYTSYKLDLDEVKHRLAPVDYVECVKPVEKTRVDFIPL